VRKKKKGTHLRTKRLGTVDFGEHGSVSAAVLQ